MKSSLFQYNLNGLQPMRTLISVAKSLLGLTVAAAADCNCPPKQGYCKANSTCGAYGELYLRDLIDCGEFGGESWCKYSAGAPTTICC